MEESKNQELKQYDKAIETFRRQAPLKERLDAQQQVKHERERGASTISKLVRNVYYSNLLNTNAM